VPEANATYRPRALDALSIETIEVWTDAHGVIRARDVHWTRRRILRAIATYLVCGAVIVPFTIFFGPHDRFVVLFAGAVVAWVCLGIILFGGYHAFAQGADYLRFDPHEGVVHLPAHKHRIPIDQVLRVVLIKFQVRHSEFAATYDVVLETTADGSERWLCIARLNTKHASQIEALAAGLGVPQDNLELGEVTLDA